MDIYPRYIPRELQWEIFLNKAKKTMTCYFLPTEVLTKFIPSGKSVGKMLTLFIMLIIDGITNGKFRRYFLESSGTIHSSIALLIIVF